MKVPKEFISVDYHIQAIIGVLCIAFSFLFYGLLLLLPFGIWQVISSLVLVLGYNNKKRVPHLIFVAIWSAILGLLVFFEFEIFPFYFFYVILLPAGVGIWYFIMTRKDYLLSLKDNKGVSREGMEDILDIDL